MKFKGGDSPSIRSGFLDRKSYKESVKLEGVDFLDTWYENPNYGRLNSHFEPVYLNTQDAAITLKTFASLAVRR